MDVRGGRVSAELSQWPGAAHAAAGDLQVRCNSLAAQGSLAGPGKNEEAPGTEEDRRARSPTRLIVFGGAAGA
jgi:hypothetical protein